ncbi:MAG: mismatch-specific DNA-glycosylase [Candidatus Tectomicrobia bacterium]|nr:mismatch-specific DNA-glycosylase [Candidatus Tectomicrobia bacterium]
MLPDYLDFGLRLVVVGFNPGTKSARLGHYYAGPGNLFWPLLYEAGLTRVPLNFAEDHRVLEFGIGLTDLVRRSTPSSADLTRREVARGREALLAKLQRYAPRVICFNGKGVYEHVRPRLGEARAALGAQADLGASRVFVMPSTSARNGRFPRAAKLEFFRAMKRLVDSVA